LKYHISAEKIKKINRLTTDKDLWTRCFINIPVNNENSGINFSEKKKSEIDTHKSLVSQFQRTTKCEREEAQFYLEENNFNFENAINEYNADISFEKNFLTKK